MASFKEGLAAFARGPKPAGAASAPIIPADELRDAKPLRLHSLEAFSMPSADAASAEPEQESLDEQLERKFQQGFEAGRDAALRAHEREQRELWERTAMSLGERAQRLAAQFEAELLDRDQKVAEGLLDLALEVAARIVARHVAVDREHSVAVVQECLALLPSPARDLRLFVNPDDAQGLLQAAPELRERDIEIIADASIEAGGCRLRNEQFDIDATIQTRWRRTLAALGRADTSAMPGEARS